MFDLADFLQTKLQFIRSLYSTSTEPFITTIRKIDRNEAPFDEYEGDPECVDPFLDEWERLSPIPRVTHRGYSRFHEGCFALAGNAVKELVAPPEPKA